MGSARTAVTARSARKCFLGRGLGSGRGKNFIKKRSRVGPRRDRRWFAGAGLSGGRTRIVKHIVGPLSFAFEFALSLYISPRAARRAQRGRNAFCGIRGFLREVAERFFGIVTARND